MSSIEALKPDDWKRYIFYAARVKSLRVDYVEYPACEMLFQTELLLNLCPSRPLFPKLDDISLFLEHNTHRSISEDINTLTSYTKTLLHEGVRKLCFGGSIFLDWNNKSMERVLTEISTRCPNLRIVDGPSFICMVGIQPVLFKFATSFNQVENLTILAHGFSPTLFVSLGHLNNLQFLRSDPGRMPYPTGIAVG